MIGSEVMAILLNEWILPIGGVPLEWVCKAGLFLLFTPLLKILLLALVFSAPIAYRIQALAPTLPSQNPHYHPIFSRGE